jgi:hypothetical protein
MTQLLILVAAGVIGGLIARWTTGPQIAVAADKQPWSGRGYYLTKGKVQGDKAVSACASGFHMGRQWCLLFKNRVFRSFWRRQGKVGDATDSAYEYHQQAQVSARILFGARQN